MFDLISASVIWMNPKGSLSKFTCTNTVTSSRALSWFRKKLIWKISPKIHLKETIIEVLFSVTSQPATSLKTNPITVFFLMTFEKIFQNIVLCQNTGKTTQGTEVFVRICFRKKLIWRISQTSPKRNYGGVFFS